MLKKYNYICNDEDEYLFIIFDATKLAIDTYKEERGNFDNYWNTLIRNKKTKFINEKYNFKNRYVKTFSLNDSEELETFEKLTFHDSAKSSFEQKTNSMYLLDVRKRIFKILDSCTIFDKKIFALYFESYNFNEIAEILNVTRNKIIARFYYLCKVIRSRIDFKDYF